MQRVESVGFTQSRGMNEMMSSSAGNAAVLARGDVPARAKILLALECAVCRAGVRAILEREFEVSDVNEDEEALVEVARKLQPDVIVMELSLPKLDGIAVAESIKKEQRNLILIFWTFWRSLVIVNSLEDLNQFGGAVEAGVSDYHLRRSEPSELLRAIREALQGRIYVTPLLPSDMIAYYRSHARRLGHSHAPLTPRQVEVLERLVEGRTAREIGELLHISARTVEFHKYNMMEKLGLARSAELVQYALRHGISQPHKAGPIPPRNR